MANDIYAYRRVSSGERETALQTIEQKGRQLPSGVFYLNSWINETLTTCYQLMESDTEEKIHEWISHWKDLADFEVVKVISSTEAKKSKCVLKVLR